MPNTVVLDENVVSGFSNQQAVTYFGLYIKNTGALIIALERDFENKDFEAIRPKAHKIKGSSLVIGASAMNDIAKLIEEDARDRSLADAMKLQSLKDQFEQLSHLVKIRFNVQ